MAAQTRHTEQIADDDPRLIQAILVWDNLTPDEISVFGRKLAKVLLTCQATGDIDGLRQFADSVLQMYVLRDDPLYVKALRSPQPASDERKFTSVEDLFKQIQADRQGT